MKTITYRLAIIRDDGHVMGSYEGLVPEDASPTNIYWEAAEKYARHLLRDSPKTAAPVLSPGSSAPAAADNGGGHPTQFDVVFVCGNDGCAKVLDKGGCYCSAKCAEEG